MSSHCSRAKEVVSQESMRYHESSEGIFGFKPHQKSQSHSVYVSNMLNVECQSSLSVDVVRRSLTEGWKVRRKWGLSYSVGNCSNYTVRVLEY